MYIKKAPITNSHEDWIIYKQKQLISGNNHNVEYNIYFNNNLCSYSKEIAENFNFIFLEGIGHISLLIIWR